MKADWAALSSAVVRLAGELQQIPAPTFHEDRRAEFTLARMKTLGLIDCQLDSAGNALGKLPGGGRAGPLIFSAHMDTVFPLNFPLKLELCGSKANGPGIGDNSLGLAVLLFIPELLRAAGIQPAGDIWLAGTTGEEGLGDLKGIWAIAARFGALARGYVSLEGMGLGSILHRGLGVERYRVSATTRGGHSWVDYGSPSAIHELAACATRLAGLKLPRKPRSTLNIGLIQGGTSINSVAANAWMEVDLRSESAPGLSELTRRFEQIVNSANRKEVAFRLEKIGKRPAAEIPKEHWLVRLAARALSEQGILPNYDIASTEANAPLSRGYPAVTIGITSGDRAHTAEEYIDIPPIVKGLKQVVTIAAHAWEGV